jgi:exopolysaccharide biosynthesis polyprenyl glycosylphosphotransferase
VALDLTAAVLGWSVAVLASGKVVPGNDGAMMAVPLAALATCVLADRRRLYRARVCRLRSVELQRLGQVVAAVCALVILVGPRIGVGLPAEVVALSGLVSFSLSFAFRGAYRSWLAAGRRNGRFQRSVVVVGTNEEGRDLHGLVTDHPELGLSVVGVVGDRAQMAAIGFDAPFLGPISTAERLVRMSGASGVLVATTALTGPELNSLTRELLHLGVHVDLSSGLRGIAAHRLRPHSLAHEPLLSLEPMRLSRWQLMAKRAVDLVLGTVGLLVSAPVLLVAAIAIKIDDGGPVVFRQRRVGRNGRIFTMFKLRTMTLGAEDRYSALAPELAGRTGPLVKLHDDPRVTTVGRVLRATSIDELPQLFNVLRGSMSVVGPRPNLLVEAEGLDPVFLAHKGTVRPGITGLWQVEARDDPSFAAYRRLDLFYLENWSMSLDAAILCVTGQRVVARAVRLRFGGRPRTRHTLGLGLDRSTL